jgi:hypothetical protein
VNQAGCRADRAGVAYKTEGPYFVNLDAPEATSRTTAVGREQHWADDSTRGPVPVPAHRRRKRKTRVRPAWLIVIALLSWIGWAYTTPGGPSARIGDWIDHTRDDVTEATVNPELRRSAAYFNGLFATQRRYPNLSDAEVQAAPNSGLGLGVSFEWCGPRAVVLHTLNSGGSVSRLLLDGKDLGNVATSRPCPSNLANPSPWKLPKKTS